MKEFCVYLYAWHTVHFQSCADRTTWHLSQMRWLHPQHTDPQSQNCPKTRWHLAHDLWPYGRAKLLVPCPQIFCSSVFNLLKCIWQITWQKFEWIQWSGFNGNYYGLSQMGTNRTFTEILMVCIGVIVSITPVDTIIVFIKASRNPFKTIITSFMVSFFFSRASWWFIMVCNGNH